MSALPGLLENAEVTPRESSIPSACGIDMPRSRVRAFSFPFEVVGGSGGKLCSRCWPDCTLVPLTASTGLVVSGRGDALRAARGESRLPVREAPPSVSTLAAIGDGVGNGGRSSVAGVDWEVVARPNENQFRAADEAIEATD